ncbi:MAG TPA: hypothetical protein VGB53_09215 [Rubricoccaceae bacterium]
MSPAVWTGLVAGCGVLSAVLVEVVRRAALQRAVLDVPNERSSHAAPVPRGGGLGMLAAVAAAWALAAVAVPDVRAPWLAVGAALVAAVSALDDVRTLRAGPRFAIQAAAAALVAWATGGWGWLAVAGVGPVALGAAGIALAVVWTVGLTNAYNFMDGIDGIAGGQAVMAGAAWAAAGLWLGVPAVALVGACVAAAALGFLVHNRPPARVFMGDVGSATLGFVFAALPLVAGDALEPVLAGRLPVFALLAVWPFVYDAAATFGQRLARRENVLAAHRQHRYQRLVIAGASHGAVSALYAALAAVSGACAVRWLVAADPWAAAVGLALVPLVLWVAVRRAERAARAA